MTWARKDKTGQHCSLHSYTFYTSMGFDMPLHKNHNEITNIDEKKNKKGN
jgi:hypothetical protein